MFNGNSFIFMQLFWQKGIPCNPRPFDQDLPEELGDLFCIRMALYSTGEAVWFSAQTLFFHLRTQIVVICELTLLILYQPW